jgi:hypothetical protein
MPILRWQVPPFRVNPDREVPEFQDSDSVKHQTEFLSQGKTELFLAETFAILSQDRINIEHAAEPVPHNKIFSPFSPYFIADQLFFRTSDATCTGPAHSQ